MTRFMRYICVKQVQGIFAGDNIKKSWSMDEKRDYMSVRNWRGDPEIIERALLEDGIELTTIDAYGLINNKVYKQLSDAVKLLIGFAA